MPAPADRRPLNTLELTRPLPWPAPPLNVSASSAFRKQAVDVRWSSPSEIQSNTCFTVLGVNVYRSFDSEFGPYVRLNTVPVGSGFWRDETRVVLAMNEDVSRSFVSRGAPDDVAVKWVFRTAHRPIVIHPSPGSANCTNLNVQVTVNGVPAFVEAIYADIGSVELRHVPTFDVASQIQTPPVLPLSESDVVLATYRYVADRVDTDLAKRLFYRVTTVAYDAEANSLVETPLDRASITNRDEIEKLDWIWREAVRRNRWILYQGGERVKAFVRKSVGVRCGCESDTHRHADSTCLVCFGTGFIGGYEGPYDIIVAPDDADKSIGRSNRGTALAHSYESWTGPSPLLSQRDFVVKMNGDRYGLGPVRMPSNRGMQLQQFFTLSHLDEQDIRYRVPLPDPAFMRAPETRWIVPGRGGSTPMMTEKVTIPDERELRGNTVTYENHNY